MGEQACIRNQFILFFKSHWRIFLLRERKRRNVLLFASCMHPDPDQGLNPQSSGSMGNQWNHPVGETGSFLITVCRMWSRNTQNQRKGTWRSLVHWCEEMLPTADSPDGSEATCLNLDLIFPLSFLLPLLLHSSWTLSLLPKDLHWVCLV